jgi:hypothetical protein
MNVIPPGSLYTKAAEAKAGSIRIKRRLKALLIYFPPPKQIILLRHAMPKPMQIAVQLQ